MEIYLNAQLARAVQQWEDWLTHIRQLSPHTVRAYVHDVQHFLKFYAEHQGKQLSYELLADAPLHIFHSWLAQKALREKNAATSRARALSSLKHFYKWCDNEGYFHNGVIAVLKGPKLKKHLPRPLDEDQAATLHTQLVDVDAEPWVNHRDVALVTLMYGAGLRVQEALSLNQGDISADKSQDTLRLIGKGNKEREVPLLPIIHDAMAAYRHDCPYDCHTKTAPLFYGIRGKRLHQGMIQKRLRDVRAQFNLPKTLTPHALRHSFATHILQRGGGLRDIQELLGHAALSTTQRYTDLQLEDLRRTLEASHPRT